jgi:excisionase family DNA binding protein
VSDCQTTPLVALWTAEEIARALRVDDRTVLAWAKEGRIPSVRLARRVVRFDPNDVMAAVNRWKV